MAGKETKRFVYLVRHGRAEDTHRLGDEARALTAEGRDELRAFARDLRRELVLEGIATSPLVRAVQTAEILAEACGISDVRVRRELKYPGASARTIGALAGELGPGWALVGHNPSLSEALSHMLDLDPEEARMRKGSVVALAPAKAEGRWELAWSVSPGKKKRSRL